MGAVRTAVGLVVLGTVGGGIIYLDRREPVGTSVIDRASTWLRAHLHRAPQDPALHGENRVVVAPSQDRVYAVVRDPSVWSRSLTQITHDPTAVVTKSGSPMLAGYVFSWTSESKSLAWRRGRVEVKAFEPPNGIRFRITNLDGSFVVPPADVGVQLKPVDNGTEIAVVVDFAPGADRSVRASVFADFIATAMKEAVEQPVGKRRTIVAGRGSGASSTSGGLGGGVASGGGIAGGSSGAPSSSETSHGTSDHADVVWNLSSCKNVPGCLQAAFTRTCGQVGMKTVRFTVTDEHTHTKLVTRAPCPAGDSEGEFSIDVPKGPGPFTLTAASDEVSTARSERVCHITPHCWARGFSIGIFAQGCNDPECISCDASSPAGWCE